MGHVKVKMNVQRLSCVILYLFIRYLLKFPSQIIVFVLHYKIIPHSGLDFMRMARNIDFQIYEMSLVEPLIILRRNTSI